MRQIDVDVDVFAMIWAERRSSEQNENQILRRVLSNLLHRDPLQRIRAPLDHPPDEVATKEIEGYTSFNAELEASASKVIFGKTRWVDDVRAALMLLGGAATLHQIYGKVAEIRQLAGRSVPKTLEATIRRTIEDHSSDSENFRGVDIFEKVSRGEWALRERRQSHS